MANLNWKQLLEAMDDVAASVDNGPENAEDINDAPIEPETAKAPLDEKELLEELNKLFTPVLVMQGYQSDIADKVNAEISEIR